VDLDHPPARQSAHPQREVEPERACRHDLDILRDVRFAEAHDRALAELFLDLGQRCGQRFGFVLFHVMSPFSLSRILNHPCRAHASMRKRATKRSRRPDVRERTVPLPTELNAPAASELTCRWPTYGRPAESPPGRPT